MTSVFDDASRAYLVLVNDLHQHSLWPAAIAVPEGWVVRCGPAHRDDCLDHVRANWTDMRTDRE